MSRRAFLGLRAGAVAWPLVVPAQDVSRVRQVGVVFGATDHQENASRLAVFTQKLDELAWELIVSRANRHKLPAVYPYADEVIE